MGSYYDVLVFFTKCLCMYKSFLNSKKVAHYLVVHMIVGVRRQGHLLCLGVEDMALGREDSRGASQFSVAPRHHHHHHHPASGGGSRGGGQGHAY